MTVEHIKTEPHDKLPAQAAPALAQRTLDGGSEPVVTSDAADAQGKAKKPRGPKRSAQELAAFHREKAAEVEGRERVKLMSSIGDLADLLDGLSARAVGLERKDAAAVLTKAAVDLRAIKPTAAK